MEIASYIGADSPRSAERFLAAAERTIERLARQPLSGSSYALEHPALADVRMTPIQRFTRYLIYYRVVGGVSFRQPTVVMEPRQRHRR